MTRPAAVDDLTAMPELTAMSLHCTEEPMAFDIAYREAIQAVAIVFS
jgi:hypothetical protein